MSNKGRKAKRDVDTENRAKLEEHMDAMAPLQKQITSAENGDQLTVQTGQRQHRHQATTKYKDTVETDFGVMASALA